MSKANKKAAWVEDLTFVLEECARVHELISNAAPRKFKHIDSSDLHPVYVSEALSTLLIELTSQYYDMVFLASILSSCCTDIERGEYHFVEQTH